MDGIPFRAIWNDKSLFWTLVPPDSAPIQIACVLLGREIMQAGHTPMGKFVLLGTGRTVDDLVLIAPAIAVAAQDDPNPDSDVWCDIYAMFDNPPYGNDGEPPKQQ